MEAHDATPVVAVSSTLSDKATNGVYRNVRCYLKEQIELVCVAERRLNLARSFKAGRGTSHFPSSHRRRLNGRLSKGSVVADATRLGLNQRSGFSYLADVRRNFNHQRLVCIGIIDPSIIRFQQLPKLARSLNLREDSQFVQVLADESLD